MKGEHMVPIIIKQKSQTYTESQWPEHLSWAHRMRTYFYYFGLGVNEVLGITDTAATNTKEAREVWAGSVSEENNPTNLDLNHFNRLYAISIYRC